MSKVKTQLKLAETPVYSYFSALYKSFYSSALYVDVGKRWRGIGIVYLLLVMSLFSLVSSFKVVKNFSSMVEQDLIQPLRQLPLVYIQNGKVSIDKPMPYLVKNTKNQVVIIVDNTGKITDFTPEYPNLNILFTKDRMFINYPTPQFLEGENVPQKKPRVQVFDKSFNSVFDGKVFVSEDKIKKLILFTELMIFPLLLALLFGASLALFLAFSLMAQLVAQVFFKFQLSYTQACRLLFVSATPMFTLLLIYIHFDLVFYGMKAIMFAVLFVYYGFAVYSLRKASQSLAK